MGTVQKFSIYYSVKYVWILFVELAQNHWAINHMSPLLKLACRVNSIQEACNKCFAVDILKFEILQITWNKWNKWNKEHQTLSFGFFINKSKILMFSVVCKISNFNLWTAKHLAQASCTELTVRSMQYFSSLTVSVELISSSSRLWIMY